MAGSKQSKKLNSAITQELMGDVERVEFMLMSYWKVLVLALALVVIVIVAGFWGCSSYRASQHRAAVALADAATADLLMVHAQDHYMTSQLARDLIEELVKIFEARDAE